MPAPKSAPTTFRFQPEVKNTLAVISEHEGRSMATMLELLIKLHCEARMLGWPLPTRSSLGAGRQRARSGEHDGQGPKEGWNV